MADREKIVNNIKKGGSLVIYVGTASLMKPFIKNGDEKRSAVSKACAVATGAVLSCGISSQASKFFSKMVDTVADFLDDVKPKKKQEDHSNGKS